MLLSIIIPTYNRVHYLENLLCSIVKQIDIYSLENTVEILISNNNSSDSTKEFVNSFINKYPKISFIFLNNEKNIGGIKNFFKLLENVKGSYWYFIGDDDLLAENSLLKVVNCIKENNNIPIFIFNQQNNILIKETKLISIQECANKYFYYIGNLCTIADTKSTQDLLRKYYNDLIQTPWPQTHLFFLTMIFSKELLPAYVSEIIIFNTQKKNNNNISNAFYHFDSQFYSFIKLSYFINLATPQKKVIKSFRNGIPYLKKFNFFRFIIFTVTSQYKLFDTEKENIEYIETLNQAFQYVKLKEKIILFWFYLFLLIPKFIYKHLYVIFKFFELKTLPNFCQYYVSLKNIEKILNIKKENLIDKHSLIINKGEW